jgi:hydroxyquinol 1,2-dioxygenase
MIIQGKDQVTEAVLDEMKRTPNPRTREILESFVRHLHDFIREVRLTEPEFHRAIQYVNAIGQTTTPSHNEAMLLSGALGVSNLVCLLNNTALDSGGTHANTLGPFWRAGAPFTENGGSIVRSSTPGPALHVRGWVRDRQGKPIADAEIDVWEASPAGLYENQDASQAEMNLRGRFKSDADGSFSFESVKPSGYPVPTAGPTGDLLRAQGRHEYRPAHVHFLIYKRGFKTISSQVYDAADPNLETDSQFGVTDALIGNYVKQPDGSFSLDFTFVLEPGESVLPKPPIAGKAEAKA